MSATPPVVDADATVLTAFRDVVRKHPELIAVSAADGHLTYRELERRAGALAGRLTTAGVRPGDHVLVGVERSAAALVGLLAIAWVGATWVAIDDDLPAARWDDLLEQVRPTAIVAGPGLRHPPGPLPVVPPIAHDEPAPPPHPGRADDICYVAFTSGSTGRPKGARVRHRGVLRLACRADYLDLGPGERVVWILPLAFDGSTMEIWCALLTGATLCVFPPGPWVPQDLVAYLRETCATVLMLTPGLFQLTVDMALDDLGSVRQFVLGGDVPSPRHVRAVLQRWPGTAVINAYGPTENTTTTTAHRMTSAVEVEDPIPIGRPITGTGVVLLRPDGQVVHGPGEGELVATGDGLAAGYLNPHDNDGRFGLAPDGQPAYRTGDIVRRRPDGLLVFLGRIDHQVKVRGHRVELEEVQRTLLTHPAVRDCAILTTPGDSLNRRVAAFVVPDGGWTPADYRTFLGARLPAWAVPSVWRELGAIPVRPSGKVDRSALAAALVAGSAP